MSETGGMLEVDAAPTAAGAPSTREQIRAIGRHTLIYGAGVVATKLASFIMLPVYTRYLTPADYGVLELLSMTIEIIGTIAGMGLSAAVFKFYVDHEGTNEQRTIMSTAGVATLALGVVTSGLGLLFSPALGHLVFGQGAGSNPVYFRLFFLIYLVQSAEMVPLLLLRARNESWAFVGASVAKLIGQLTLNIVFVVYLHMGVLGVLRSNLIITSISATGLTAYAVWRVGAHFSLPKFKGMARFGYPVMPWLLSNFVLVFSDRYFLNNSAGPAVVGIYSLAYKFAFLLAAFAFMPFNMVWDPQRYAIARKENAPRIYARVFTYLNIGLGVIAMLISVYVDDLLRIMATPPFRPAALLVPVLLAAQVIYSWTAFCNVGLFLRDRTRVLSRLSFVAVASVLVLNVLLIPRFGAWGAALATLGGYAVRSGTVIVASQRAYRIPYEWGLLVRLYAILAAAVVADRAIGSLALLPSIVASSALALGACAAVYFVVLTADDRRTLRGMIAHSRTLLVPWLGRA